MSVIPESRIDGQIVTNADDICLIFLGKTWKFVHAKTTYELNKVIHLLTSMKLSLNTKDFLYDFHY